MTTEALLLAGVPAAVLVTGIVELLKAAGMPSRYAALAAVAAGVAVAVLAQVATVSDTARPWIEAVATGVMIGLSASGIYSGYKALTSGR